MKRTDIMIDLETLGTDPSAPIIQISAVEFDINTGDILDKFNLHLDIETQDKFKVQPGTLKWWLETNATLLKKKLTEELQYNYYDSIINFVNWLETKDTIKGSLNLWGNGILFDNLFIINQYEALTNKTFPISYGSHKDVRTILDLAAVKLNISIKEYKSGFPNIGTEHDGLSDCIYQAVIVSNAYNILTK